MTDYLYAKPDFLLGIARVLDLGSTLNVYNESPTPELADYNAAIADSMAVAGDMWAAIERFEAEHATEGA